MTGNNEFKSPTKCRICFNSSKQLKSLKKRRINRKQEKISYAQLLKEVTNINIMDKKFRKMSQFICTWCLRKLKIAHAFVRQAQKVHNKLWHFLQMEQETKKELECLQEIQIDIKPRLKIEIEDFDIDKLLKSNIENGIQFETIEKDEFDIMDDDTCIMDLDSATIDIVNSKNKDTIEPNKQYACEHCESFYTTKYRLTHHLMKIHSIDSNSKEITATQIDRTSRSVQQYDCEHCESHYKTNSRVVCHLKHKHNIVENLKDELQHDEQFEIEDQKELDIMDDTTMINNTSTVEINNTQEQENTTHKRFYCEKCNSSYTKKFILNRHIREKHQTNSKKAMKDSKICSNTDKIMEPTISFTGYRCIKCSLKFVTQLELIQHFKHHAEEKSYNSDQCIRTTSKTKDETSVQKEKTCVVDKNIVLKKQNPNPPSDFTPCSLVDSEKKRFQCKLCEKSFDKSKQLSVHMRVHTVDRPFKCNECYKAYTKPCDLRIHQRKHTGEKPYTCGYCHMTFALTHSLKQHQKKCPNIESQYE